MMLTEEIAEAAVVDFETDSIRPRPEYPPQPVGVAVKIGAGPSTYFAWGHPADNTCVREEAVRVLSAVWGSERPLLFHNAPFDLAVAHERFGLPLPSWQRVHDSLPMLFLVDPRAESYSLKPSSEKLLNWPPEERDAVIDWLIEHQPIPGVKISRTPGSEHYAGAYIGSAPASVVSPYARGDVERTRALALWAASRVQDQDMIAPYDRERRLMPVLLAMERDGVRVDLERLAQDIRTADATMNALDCWLWARLGAEINLDSGAELANALVACGAASRESLGVTATGRLCTSKDALRGGVEDAQLRAVLRYRGRLRNSLTTFMRPWCETAQRSGGKVFTTWHSTRKSHHETDVGTRTGRLSSTPNFQNCSKGAEAIFVGDDPKQTDLPPPPAGLVLPPLPLVRGYFIPQEPGHILCGRDFSGQELRVLAHYEDDVLRRAYNENPALDLHQFVADQLAARGFPIGRKRTKTVQFAVIYGTGVGHLAEMLSTTVEESRKTRDAYFGTFPSIKRLVDEVSRVWKRGGMIRTWGGRCYTVEAPKMVAGRVREFSYKALNLLIQGSSADLTKQAMIEAHEAGLRLQLTVHDEIMISAPRATWQHDIGVLRDIMNRPRLDVPMLSDGYVGDTWGAVKGCE